MYKKYPILYTNMKELVMNELELIKVIKIRLKTGRKGGYYIIP